MSHSHRYADPVQGVDPLLDSRSAWRNQGAEFCELLRETMEATFAEQYPKLGAKVLLNK
jgi:hypothetical protein